MIESDVYAFRKGGAWFAKVVENSGIMGPYKTLDQLVQEMVRMTYTTSYDVDIVINIYEEDEPVIAILKPAVL